jgi:hypothetical protein
MLLAARRSLASTKSPALSIRTNSSRTALASFSTFPRTSLFSAARPDFGSASSSSRLRSLSRTYTSMSDKTAKVIDGNAMAA